MSQYLSLSCHKITIQAWYISDTCICFVYRYDLFGISDYFATFVDICTNTIKTGDIDVHLISSDSLRNSKQCQCSIKGGGFSVLVNDVRLTAKSERNCTPVTLNIFSFKYECNIKKGVFNFQLGAASAFTVNISLKSTARDILPEMIWITVQPKGMYPASHLYSVSTLLCLSMIFVKLDVSRSRASNGKITYDFFEQ